MSDAITLQIGDTLYSVEIMQEGDGYTASIDGRIYTVALRRGPHGRLDLALGDGDAQQTRARVYLAQDGRRLYAAMDGVTWIIDTPSPHRQRRQARNEISGTLAASMPGLVLDVLVEPGTVVEKGATLVLLEAMKMELRITAPADGRIADVHCAAGDVVARGQQLLSLESGSLSSETSSTRDG